jgi:hypothetical protein
MIIADRQIDGPDMSDWGDHILGSGRLPQKDRP